MTSATGSANVLKHRYLHSPFTDQVFVNEVFKTVGSQQVVDKLLWPLAGRCDLVNEYGTLRMHVSYDAFGNMGAAYWDARAIKF